MKRAVLLLVGLAAGCAKAPEAQLQKVDALQAHVSQLEDRIEKIEREMARPREIAEVDERLKEEIRILRRELDQNGIVYRSVTDDIRNQVRGIDRRLNELESRPPPQPAAVEKPPAPAQDKSISAYPPPVPPRPPQPASVPIRVFNITGRQVVTGTHKSTRYVETDETYRDEYGVKTKRVQPVEVDVNEYAYEVVFAMENESDVEREVAASAGTVTRTYLLKARETITNATVSATAGARLRITSGGISRSYTVPY